MKILSLKGENFNDLCPELYREAHDIEAIDSGKIILDPKVFHLDDGDIAFAPLYQLPISKKGSKWIIAALLKREFNGLGISVGQRVLGNTLWLPQDGQLHCPFPIIEEQIAQLRPDISFISNVKNEAIRLHHYWHPSTEEKIQSIHPSELVPLAGANTMALVCLASDLSTRKKLLQYHDAPTAELTNVERRITQLLTRSPSDIGVSCTKDTHGRFHLSAVWLNESDISTCHTVQSTWIGLVEHTVSHLQSKI
jgi:hypothetical protein